MFKKLLSFFTGTNPLPQEKTQHLQTIDLYENPAPPSPPAREATRPSYRVGKHKSSDIHKAIDMSG